MGEIAQTKKQPKNMNKDKLKTIFFKLSGAYICFGITIKTW